jgi:hypothetical protein
VRIYETALEQVFMVLRGERPPYLVNPEVWDKVLAKRATLQIER